MRGELTGERWASKLTQAVGRIHFLAAVGLMAAVSSKPTPERETKASLLNRWSLINVVKAAAFHHLCHILAVRSKSQVPPTLTGRALHKAVNIRRP